MTEVERIVYWAARERYYNRIRKYGIYYRPLDSFIMDLFTKWYIEEDGKPYLCGMHGIMALFDCSYTTAVKIKKTIIQDAVIQDAPGKPFKVDPELAVKLYAQKKKKN